MYHQQRTSTSTAITPIVGRTSGTSPSHLEGSTLILNNKQTIFSRPRLAIHLPLSISSLLLILIFLNHQSLANPLQDFKHPLATIHSQQEHRETSLEEQT